MFRRQSPALKEEQERVMQKAVELANKRIREGVLDEGLYSFMQRNSVDIVPASLATLKSNWTPLEIDWNAESGFGMKLRDISDPMIHEILRNDNLYKQVELIVRQTIQETMTGDGASVFISSLLHDLILEDESFYEQSIPS